MARREESGVEVGNALRQLPSVDRLLQEEAVQTLVARYARPLVLAAVRAALDAERAAVRAGAPPRELGPLVSAVEAQAAALAGPRLRRVLNATGVSTWASTGNPSFSVVSNWDIFPGSSPTISLSFPPAASYPANNNITGLNVNGLVLIKPYPQGFRLLQLQMPAAQDAVVAQILAGFH